MQNLSEDSISSAIIVDFGSLPVDTESEKSISIENNSDVSKDNRFYHMMPV